VFYRKILIEIYVLLLFRYIVQGNMYKNTNRIDGKVAIVTGSNAGLGKETALEFAKRGAKVYLACRDMTRCEAAKKEIIDLSNNPNVFARKLDLGSLASVREFVKK
jgi:NAD(P)-dependent dehydrogenase (short-subunit alcohol dehydrogenase family)